LSLFSSSSFSSYYYHHHHHLISLSPCSIEDESSLVNCVMSLKWDGARRWNCYFIKRPTRDSIRDFPENYSTFFLFCFVRSFVRSLLTVRSVSNADLNDWWRLLDSFIRRNFSISAFEIK
jgi:hypothetical protein